MEEESLNERIRLALAESRRPPEPPLDDMWAEIERRAFDRTPRRASPLTVTAHRSRWAAPALAAAAMMIGIGLGWSVAPRADVVTRYVTSPAHTVATTAQSSITNGTADSAASLDVPHTGPVSAPKPQVTRTHSAIALKSEQRPLYGFSDARLAARYGGMGGSDMSRYLVRTAALLGSLPSDHTTATTDTAIASRAGELLTQTHLLLDSSAGGDPTLHKLLEDLELVLAQVARLNVQRSGSDLQLIHQALAVRDVLPRVHDATVEASITE